MRVMRVLIPHVKHGQDGIDLYTSFHAEDDVYATLYALYVIDRVLQPAGISVPSCSPRESSGSRTLY